MSPATTVHIVMPYYENGQLRYTPTMREVFRRLGFSHDGFPSPEIWRTGWGSERDVLTRKERIALGREA